MERVKTLISEEEICRKLDELADQINKDYEGKELHLICILKGGVMFMSELAKRLKVTVTMDFMAVASYWGDTSSSGSVKFIKDLDDPIEGKNVLIVEDIIDTGRTLSFLVKTLENKAPQEIKLCTLLDKPHRRVVNDVIVDYVAFTIPDEFVVGFGLDYDQRYRNLPYIGVVEFVD
ncbi:MAG: hypoxanthine phosphoribosyltransferase [Clostridiales bacterium]|jgi:hypoxanthine phosphoribosyltransferase|nr:hypoxanthine phosphoribosyltransferase [Bacillales bacterium]MDF2820386.1 hypoxanthine phosphoribosyltransferase [Clostridiales bacterium]